MHTDFSTTFFQESHKFSGSWITHPMFSDLAPLNVFHRENESTDYFHPERLKNVHLLFRRKFTLAPGSRRFRMDFSADDYARVKINGQTAALGPAQGYHFRYRWNSVDVTHLLREGENHIEAEVYYQGLINRAYQSGDLRCGFVMDLWELSLDGGRLILKTDETFETIINQAYTEISPRRIFGYDTQYPEDYDSRLEPERPYPQEDTCTHTCTLPFQNCTSSSQNCTLLSKDCTLPSHTCMPSSYNWIRCCVRKAADYTFAPYASPSVSFCERRPRVTKLHRPGQTFFFCDFGEEITATLKLKASGSGGQTVTILCGEEQSPEPWHVRFDMRCGCRYEEYWTLKDGENILKQFDYKGFRWCTLLVPDGVRILEISAVVRHYPFDAKACTLDTNDPVLAQVFDLCKRTVQYGCQETYVDCPTREKGQYLGDLTITSASHLWLTGDGRLLREALEDFCLSTTFCPGMCAVAPGSLMQEIADYSLQFPIIALRYYQLSHDRDFLALCLETCRNIKAYFQQFQRGDGLLEQVSEKWNMVDWPENLRDGYDFPLTRPVVGPGVHNVINAFYIGFLIQMNKMEQICSGDTKQTAEFSSAKNRTSAELEIQQLIQAFHKAFFDSRRGLYTDAESPSGHASLHANILPVYFGFYDKSAKDTLARFLLEKGICSGVYMTWFQMKALCRLGQHEAAYHMITSTGDNSWHHMLREGATTCFEAWGKAQKWNTSLCHPWATGPISVLMEDLLGYHLDGTRGQVHLPDGIHADIHVPQALRIGKK